MTTARIGDLVTVAGGGTPRRSMATFYGGGIPWVTPKDMKRAEIDSSEVTLTEEGVKNSPAKLISRESTLVVVRSGVLKHTLPVAFAATAITVNQDMKALTPRTDRIDPRFLFRLVQAQESRVLRSVRATTADNFPIESLLSIEIPLPPLPEQRRIAAILDEADALRLKVRKSADLANEVADSTFSAAMFRAGTVAPISASVHLITGPFGSSVHKSDYEVGGVPLVNPSHIRDGRIEIDTKVAVSKEKAQQLSPFALREGDVVLGRRGEMGRAAVVERFNTPALCGTGTMILRPTGGPRVGAYIARLLRTSRYVDLLTNAASGVTMLNLSQSAVGSITVPSPTPELLNLVDAIDATSRARVDAAQARLRLLNGLFASLQHRAFRGEL